MTPRLAPYIRDPRMAGLSLPEGRDGKGAGQALLEVALTIGTGAPKPMLMDDYSALLLQDAHLPEAQQAMATFQADLATLSGEIRARNERRRARGELATC